MSERSRWFVLAFSCLALGGTVQRAPAQSRNPLVGTWAQVSAIMTMPDGSKRPNPQAGPNPKGYMIYSDANRMCSQFANPARPMWKSPAEPSYEELKSVVDFMGAYCARYVVNVAESYVDHFIEIERVPNLVGEVRRRSYRFEGPDRLILSAMPPPPGVTALEITWQRVKE